MEVLNFTREPQHNYLKRRIHIKTLIKKITALTLTAVMAFSMAGNVCAAEQESEEHVQIAGFDCVFEDGQYYTEIDGERCLVINLDDYIPEDVKMSINNSAVGQENCSVLSTNASRHKIYGDTVNLTNGDYSSPEIDCNPTSAFIINIQNAFFTKTVKLSITMYSNELQGSSPSMEHTLAFSATLQEHELVIVGGIASYIKQCVLKIYKEGTTLGSPFSYSLYEC